LVPVNRKKLSDVVIDEIRRLLEEGELKIGDKLPVHSELAKQLQVSRVTLREAMHTLSLLGVLEQRSGYGTVIKAPVPTRYAESMRLPHFTGPGAVKELLEAREIVELGAMSSIVTNASADDIRRIEGALQEMQRSLKTRHDKDYAKWDLEFHRLLIKASGNRFLIGIFETLRSVTERFMTEGFRIVPSLREKALREHQRILESLKKRDSRSACHEMMRHIALRRRIFGPLLDQNDSKAP